MSKLIVTAYTDYKSPYAFLAKQMTYDLEEKYDIQIDWLPYTLHIEDYLDEVEERSSHNWRKVKYAYMDARRHANKQGLTLKGPKRIFSAYYSSAGLLFAKKHGFFREYNDVVFDKFWKHELDVDSLEEMCATITALGQDADAYRAYVEGPGRQEHDRIREEAEEAGVFGVPMFVLDNELFWGGDRISLLCERIEERLNLNPKS